METSIIDIISLIVALILFVPSVIGWVQDIKEGNYNAKKPVTKEEEDVITKTKNHFPI